MPSRHRFQEKLLFVEMRKEYDNRFTMKEKDIQLIEAEEIIPEKFLRKNAPSILHLSEPELVRYYTNLSRMNFSVDTHFYPLGSCTMKYNPKINEDIANLKGFTEIHPYQPLETLQGAMEVLYLAERYLSEITGMHSFTLQPAAGAHGELTGMLIVRAYFKDKRMDYKKVVLIPDTAHGTNPASAVLAGFVVKSVDTEGKGVITPEVLKKHITDETACLMITNPNTLGLFERYIEDISKILKENSSLLYCDGANLNALCGKTRPGDWGVDILHVNLHKTFSTPHGGGGPGAGPIGVSKELSEYLPYPIVKKKGNKYTFSKPEKSIGRVKAFGGNFLVILKALAYIMRIGESGLKDVAEISVLNANYLRVKLKKLLELPYDRACMHECVFSDKSFSRFNISTLDVAKRLIDYRFHPPTIYFPLIVKGALMIEPTETESKSTLDAFVEAFKNIMKEAEENPEILKKAPHTTPVKRLDEVRAARNPVLRK